MKPIFHNHFCCLLHKPFHCEPSSRLASYLLDKIIFYCLNGAQVLCNIYNCILDHALHKVLQVAYLLSKYRYFCLPQKLQHYFDYSQIIYLPKHSLPCPHQLLNNQISKQSTILDDRLL